MDPEFRRQQAEAEVDARRAPPSRPGGAPGEAPVLRRVQGTPAPRCRVARHALRIAAQTAIISAVLYLVIRRAATALMPQVDLSEGAVMLASLVLVLPIKWLLRRNLSYEAKYEALTGSVIALPCAIALLDLLVALRVLPPPFGTGWAALGAGVLAIVPVAWLIAYGRLRRHARAAASPRGDDRPV